MSSVMPRCRNALIALSAATLVAACGGGSSEQTGRVSVGLTDMPAEGLDKVVVRVTGVAFKREGNAPEEVEDFTPRSIDLLEQQGGRVAILFENRPMPEGKYQWVRLLMDATPNVEDSYVTLETAPDDRCELTIPSGAESGLKMNRPIDVPADGSLALTIDFDVSKSVRRPPGLPSELCASGYILRPTLRLVNNADVGAIAGTVNFDAGSPPADCSAPYVYLFEGASQTPDDLEDTEWDAPGFPTRLPVELLPGETFGSYKAAFIPAGEYTVVMTCDADTEADESLAFIFPDDPAIDGAVTDGTVTVQNNLIAEADFTVPVPTP